MSANTRIPMERIRPLVLQWLKQPGHTARLLSEKSGISERRIYQIRQGIGINYHKGRMYTYKNVEFNTADALLSAMDMEDEWYTSLWDLYDSPDAA